MRAVLVSCVVGILSISACGADVVEAVTVDGTGTGGDESSTASSPVTTMTTTGEDTSGTRGSTETSTSGGTSTESSTGGDATAATESGTTDATSTTSETTDSGTSETTDSGTSETTDGGSETTGADVCEIDPNEDDACGVCAKQACCDELSVCVDDPACACWLLCLLSGSDEVTCFGQCGDQGLVELGALNDCAQLHCPDDCP